MVYKKIFLIIIFVYLFIFIQFIPNVFALSSLDAQNLAREYTLTNEFIDSRVFQVSCEDDTYLIISVVNNKNELIFFVPVTQERKIYSEEENTIEKIFRTTYFLRNIFIQGTDNYLTIPFIDSITDLIAILNSKNAELQGIINANHSSSITSATQDAQKELIKLIDQLESIRDNTDDARKKERLFKDNSDCSQTDSVVLVLRNAFYGYNNLTQFGLNYQTATNKITEVIVAETEVDDGTKSFISARISVPPNLSRDISSIQEKLSSTNFFYSNIITEISKIGDNNPAIISKNNFLSRKDYVYVNSFLYKYDEDLKNTLDVSIKNILDITRYPYWKDRETLQKLEQNYIEVNNLIENNRYSEVIPKLNLLKLQAIKVESEGFIDISYTSHGYDYYILVAAIILVLILFIILKKKKKRLSKDKSAKKYNNSKNKDLLESFKSNDPFK